MKRLLFDKWEHDVLMHALLLLTYPSLINPTFALTMVFVQSAEILRSCTTMRRVSLYTLVIPWTRMWWRCYKNPTSYHGSNSKAGASALVKAGGIDEQQGAEEGEKGEGSSSNEGSGNGNDKGSGSEEEEGRGSNNDNDE
jgi:hypothetical protein